MSAIYLLLITGACLSTSTILLKEVQLKGYSPILFLSFSAIFGGLLLIRKSHSKNSFNAKVVIYILGSGLLSLALPQWLYSIVITHVGVNFIAIATALPTLLTYILSISLKLEKIDGIKMSGVILALSGGLIYAFRKAELPDTSSFWILLTMTVPIIIAAGNVFRSYFWPTGFKSDQLASGLLLSSGFLIPALSFLSPINNEFSFSWELLLFVTIQALIFTIQYRSYYQLQEKSGPTYLSLIGTVSALISIPISVTLLKEDLPQDIFPGAVLMLLGLFLFLLKTYKHTYSICETKDLKCLKLRE